jgi:hypothetical protein
LCTPRGLAEGCYPENNRPTVIGNPPSEARFPLSQLVSVGIRQIGWDMANIQRIRIALTGGPGLPGVATFYALDASAALPELKGLWAEWLVKMPIDITVEYPTLGDIIDPVTGELSGTWSAGSRASDQGTADYPYAAPVGAVCNWLTDTVVDGSRLRGKTFIVPLVTPAFDAQGRVGTLTQAALQNSADDKVATMTGNFVIWHRPVHATLAGPPARLGSYGLVTHAKVPQLAAVLRSRR